MALLAAVIFGALTVFEREKPVIAMADIPEYLGANTTMDLTLTDKKSGLRSIRIAINQENQGKEVLFTEYPRQGYMGKIGPTEVKEISSLISRSWV
jgi:hypothetical protein